MVGIIGQSCRDLYGARGATRRPRGAGRGRLRNAMPSATASSTGKTKTQNTASGSRRNSTQARPGQLEQRVVAVTRSSRSALPVRWTKTSSRVAWWVVQPARRTPRPFERGQQRRQGRADRRRTEQPHAVAGSPRRCTPGRSRAARPRPRRPPAATSTICSAPSEATSSAGVPRAITLAVVHDRHPVAQPGRLLHVVGGEQHRAAAGLEALDQLPDLEARLRVEAGGRLVEEEQLRVGHQGAGQGQALPLAARELADPRPALLLELDDGDDLVDRSRPARRSSRTGGSSPRP